MAGAILSGDREDGEWKIVHRHGDVMPDDESPPAEPSTTRDA